MPRPTNRLSARSIEVATKPGRYGDGAGLYLHIDTNGSKRWVFVFQWAGSRKEMGLGSLGTVSLKRARELSKAAKQCVGDGLNPITERKTRKAASPTFGQVAEEYICAQEPRWKSAVHIRQWRMTLREYAANLTERPVDLVTTDDVMETLRPIWLKTPETASRLRGRIEAVLSAAKARKLRSGENPARWKDHLEHLLSRKPTLVRGHHPAMPYEDVPSFMAELMSRGSVSSRALQATILTALRTGEVRGATWDEIDLKTKVWTIPAARMKAGAEHRVPLTASVLGLIGDRHKGHLFPGAKPKCSLSNMAMSELLKGMHPGFTVHGFRSSFRDWVGEETEFPREVAEACLAHTLRDRVEAAYRRGDALDKRRRLLTAWEAYCMSKAHEAIELGSPV